MNIQFDTDATFDPETDSFIFFCTVDDEPLRCAISSEALMAGFKVPRDQLSSPETFAQHRDRIHSIAAKLIRAEGSNEKAGIFIICEDVPHARG